MFNECLQANKKIQKSKFTFKKLSKQVRNLIKLIKVYDTMISGVFESNVVGTKEEIKDNSLCTNCQILTERIDDLQSAIQIKDIQLSELQNNVKFKAESSKSLEINVNADSMNVTADSMQKPFVQDMRFFKVDDQENEVLLKTKILNKAAECRRRLDILQNGVQSATCKATPRDGEIHVTGRTKVSEQTGNTSLHTTQRKTLKVENTEHISE